MTQPMWDEFNLIDDASKQREEMFQSARRLDKSRSIKNMSRDREERAKNRSNPRLKDVRKGEKQRKTSGKLKCLVSRLL